MPAPNNAAISKLFLRVAITFVQVAVQPEYRTGGGAAVQPGRAPSLPLPLPARQARQEGAVRAGGAAGEAGGRAGPAEVTSSLHGCLHCAVCSRGPDQKAGEGSERGSDTESDQLRPPSNIEIDISSLESNSEVITFEDHL